MLVRCGAGGAVGPDAGRAGRRASIVSTWSSQRTSASAAKTRFSRTSSQARPLSPDARGSASGPRRVTASAEARRLRRSRRRGKRLALEPGEVVQVAQGGGALGLDDPLHVDVRGGDGQGQLDGQLVARGVGAVDGGAPPGAELGVPRRREAVGDAALGIRLAGRLDEAVTHQPVEGRVDLPDVERPGATGARLELGAQLRAVLLALGEQGHQPRPDRHRGPLLLGTTYRYVVRRRRCIPSMWRAVKHGRRRTGQEGR